MLIAVQIAQCYKVWVYMHISFSWLDSALWNKARGGVLYNLRREAPDPTLCLARAAYWARALARWAACRSMALLERRADAPDGPEPRRADPSVPNASKCSNINIPNLRHLMFPQWCHWRCKPSVMLYCHWVNRSHHFWVITVPSSSGPSSSSCGLLKIS